MSFDETGTIGADTDFGVSDGCTALVLGLAEGVFIILRKSSEEFTFMVVL
jgi:hypothetical protein